MSSRDLRKPITARELARLIGVSQSAVSRAYTPGASISSEMRQRILSTAESLGYSPNAIASTLSKRRSNIVGIVVSDMQNPFYPTLIEKLSRGLQTVGQQSLMFNLTPGSDIKQQLVALRQYNVDAVVIVSAAPLSGSSLVWATEGRKAIMINRTVPDSDITGVCCNNAEGARAIADHFHALGRRRVAFVAGVPHASANLERQHAFIARVAELGMTLTASVAGGEYSYDAGYRSAIEIARTTRTDAIFFANDILAVGGLDALRDEMALSVPGDIAVAGFDDIAMARWPRYSLTTFRQPLDAMVELTVRLVTGKAEPAEAGNVHLLPGELVVRKTTAGG
ncbi:LacI family DNA-binding transcriptional regulator [Inquilinus limosus]|uniref:LacI family DNA-binding transcriptional regulator n=1 Tax=Inquilinus limosus TaxID=171674 RepID=UPI003F1929FE